MEIDSTLKTIIVKMLYLSIGEGPVYTAGQMKKFAQIFIAAFAIVWTLTTVLVGLISFDFKLGALIGVPLGFIFGLFCVGFLIRPVKKSTFTIDSSNKDPNKGILFYRENAELFLRAHRFQLGETKGQSLTAYSRGLYRVMHSDFHLSWDAYSLTIEGPHNLLVQMLVHLDLHQIFGQTRR